MKITLTIAEKRYTAELSKPIDVSIPLKVGEENPNCFYAPYPTIDPVRAGDFVGSTAEGGLVNFLNVTFNPHGTGTHTESVGHLAKEVFTINQSLKEFFFPARLLSIYPKKMDNGDRVIGLDEIKTALDDNDVPEALLIRTLPNSRDKLNRNYSGTNPPFFRHEAISYLVDNGLKHLLIDLPSVDREEDEGKLLAHRAFWQYPDQIRENSTITEMIFVGDEVKDGLYLLNIQIASFEIDVSPSKPVIYALKEIVE